VGRERRASKKQHQKIEKRDGELPQREKGCQEAVNRHVVSPREQEKKKGEEKKRNAGAGNKGKE